VSAERASDDLAGLIGTARTGVPGLGLGLASATLLTWDPESLRGTVDYDGATLVDLPVLAALDAFSWVPGDELTLLTWHPPDGHSRPGFGSYVILGRVFRPGAENSAKVLQALQTSFASQISAEVFAARIRTAEVGDYKEISSTDWIDLPDSPGPTLPDIEVSSTGVMLVEVGCFVSADDNAGYMSVEVSGATSRAPTLRHIVSVLAAAGDGPNAIAAGRQFPVTGLNPGMHTVTAKYRTDSTSSPGALFGDRTLDVISF
jgi:hypothetical protein